MDCSLLVYRNKNWFLTVNFISCNFAELINSNRFLWILQTRLNNFTSSSPIWQINPFAFSFFFPLIVWARTSSAMLNSYWQCWELLCFVPDLREKTFSLSSFIEYDVSYGLCIDAHGLLCWGSLLLLICWVFLPWNSSVVLSSACFSNSWDDLVTPTFVLLVGCITLIDFCILDSPYILGIQKCIPKYKKIYHSVIV